MQELCSGCTAPIKYSCQFPLDVRPPAAESHMCIICMSNENWQKSWVSGIELQCAVYHRSYMIALNFALMPLSHIFPHALNHISFDSEVCVPCSLYKSLFFFCCYVSVINQNMKGPDRKRLRTSFLALRAAQVADTKETMPPLFCLFCLQKALLLKSFEIKMDLAWQRHDLGGETLCE